MQVDRKTQNAKPKYKNTLECLRITVNEEGILGLYSGLSASLFGVAVSNGIYFYWYSLLKSLYEGTAPTKKQMSVAVNLLIGAGAGAINVLMTNPIWVISTRMQTLKQSRVLESVADLFQESGFLGFYKGLIPALILCSNPAIQFVVYEKCRAGRTNLTALHYFLLGAFAKLVATGVTYPLLSIKSRLQVNSDSDAGKYNGVHDAIIKILRFEGIPGFYKGVTSKLLQSVLTAALLFLVQEKFVIYTRILVALLVYRTTKIKRN